MTAPGMRRFTVSDPAVRRRVEAAVRAVATAHPKPEQSCDYRLDLARGPEKVVVKQYTNGTLFLQGTGSLLADIVAAVEGATGVASSPVGTASKRAADPDLTRPFDPPWVGSDEAGKGDYFGPLVTAAVWVDDRTLGLLEAIGARDSKAVTDACAKHGGFYLGSIGGPAARLAKDCITKVEVLDYPELGMEAVWRIEVQDFPAFVVVDDKGNDFFAQIATEHAGKNLPVRG